MSTSLSGLLDTLADAARGQLGAVPVSALIRADAATALGHLGRALRQLHADGVSAAIGDVREHQLTTLAHACADVAACAPVAEARLTVLAAAGADVVAVHRHQMTASHRWAVTTMITDAVEPLGDLIESGMHIGPMIDRLAALRRHVLRAQQTAALNPPTRAALAVLDWPIPSPAVQARRSDTAIVVGESTAALAFSVRRHADTLCLAEVLAITLATQTLSAAARSFTPGPPMTRTPGGHLGADDAWRAVRASLARFSDGSPNLHVDPTPIAEQARLLHHGLRHADSGWAARTESAHAVLAEATQHLPAIASDLHRRANSWVRSEELLAYARDLPVREDRIAAHLAGYRAAGIVRADALDLQPVTDSIRNAELLSAELADQVRRPTTVSFPQRAWAANRALLEPAHTPAALSEAKNQAYLQLHAAQQRTAARRR